MCHQSYVEDFILGPFPLLPQGILEFPDLCRLQLDSSVLSLSEVHCAFKPRHFKSVIQYGTWNGAQAESSNLATVESAAPVAL